MKTHTIKTPTAELLVVELPRKADVEIFPNSIEIYTADMMITGFQNLTKPNKRPSTETGL